MTESLPQQVMGTDNAGIITTVLGRRNDLLEIRVAETWERRLDPSALGEAVVDASRNAERARAVANADAAVDSGVLDRLKSMRVEDFAAAPVPAATDTTGPGRVLSLDQLTAAVFSLVDGSASEDENDDVVGVSEEAEGWVAVTLARDGTMVGCKIGSHWATGRSGSAITSALNEAATAARRDLTSIATPTGKMSQADQVISDVIAFMANLNK
ncbi:hypothetical protein [Nocardia suismassiliense]|uniref:hypothetical protein n=1 Tax=Nocardia suismassiliense TaxID=2077092 RepID=UPI00131EFA91|nr:hypothetical protein [Nocardia suismassiliense]